LVPLPPNGQRVVWDPLHIFRFDEQGRLVEEWVRTDALKANPFIPIVLLWIGAFARDRSIFF
jgi:hypothetical protein